MSETATAKYFRLHKNSRRTRREYLIYVKGDFRSTYFPHSAFDVIGDCGL